MEKQDTRTLTLIRHADAHWGHSNLPDFERTLNQKGLHDALEIGKYLAKLATPIQKIMSSSAKRAEKTTQRMVLSMDLASQHITYHKELYLASSRCLLDKIHTCSNKLQHIAIVAHNPGIAALADTLTKRYTHDFPTCSFVMIRFHSKYWADLESCQSYVLDHKCPQ